jgi:hypothetical protein
VPLTIRLSKEFYDTLGEKVADELVTWLNTVDTAYRNEFRELFESNFGRVEARMRELEARIDAKLETLKSELLRWMFLFWVGTMGTVLALLKL